MPRVSSSSRAVSPLAGGQASRIRIVQSRLFAALPWLVHGFSTRPGGVSSLDEEYSRGRELNLAEMELDLPANIAENRRRFLRAWLPAARLDQVVSLRQIHSTLIWRAGENGLPTDTAGDGLITRSPETWLVIRSADCLPILLADTRQWIVAAVHAGWRGTLGRIVEKTVGEMRAAWNCRPADLKAAIGPGIRACCYEVSVDLLDAFTARFSYARELFHQPGSDEMRLRFPNLFLTGAPPGHAGDPRWAPEERARLDLAEANRRQLLAAGLQPEAIEVLPDCTACHPELFFSYRRQGARAGRMWAIIGILPAAVQLSRRKARA